LDQKATISAALTAFVTQLRARDVEGASDLFEEHAVLFGSEEGESAHGRDGLREFFERIYRRPHTYGWIWDDMTVDGDDGLLWFVAPATVVIRQDDGSETVAPYRLSGVLRRLHNDEWRFVLFNGSEPTVPT
jgi:ketosteroid isomerase-like protein